MIIEIPNGGVVDLTAATGDDETAKIAIESNFDTTRTVFLTLSSSAPTSTNDCEATLKPNISSPFCQRTISGVAGKRAYAMIASIPINSPVKIRVSVG